ncbi:MAG: N-acetyltransferase [Deltaproteobacteria bacterium]|nr:N-acetyltransferase [Deltaproteobacteria bacterium]
MVGGATNPRFRLRPIEPRDEARVADVIRTVMPEFGAGGPGFAIHDAEVDAMARAYDRPGAGYWVVELARGAVVGGAGVAPLDGGPSDTCELRKMYVLREGRGLGAGRALLERCLQEARRLGYRRCYLETLTGMDAAQHLYAEAGFTRVPAPMGCTGHAGCDRWFVREL